MTQWVRVAAMALEAHEGPRGSRTKAPVCSAPLSTVDAGTGLSVEFSGRACGQRPSLSTQNMNNSVLPGFQKKERQTARCLQQCCLEPQLNKCLALGCHTPRRHRSPPGLGPPEDTPGRQEPCQVSVFFSSSFLLIVLDFSNVSSAGLIYSPLTPLLFSPSLHLGLWALAF